MPCNMFGGLTSRSSPSSNNHVGEQLYQHRQCERKYIGEPFTSHHVQLGDSDHNYPKKCTDYVRPVIRPFDALLQCIERRSRYGWIRYNHWG